MRKHNPSLRLLKVPPIQPVSDDKQGLRMDNEYVLLETVEARLYLAARVVMDVARGKGL